MTKNEPIDIIGFDSDHHVGVFPEENAPIKAGLGIKNEIHIHLISCVSKAGGHIDDITLCDGMVLWLPKT